MAYEILGDKWRQLLPRRSSNNPHHLPVCLFSISEPWTVSPRFCIVWLSVMGIGI